MENDVADRISEIIGGMMCPKDFICVESGFALLCHANYHGEDSYLECHEVEPKNCVFSMRFKNNSFCQCPLRRYIKQKLHE